MRARILVAAIAAAVLPARSPVFGAGGSLQAASVESVPTAPGDDAWKKLAEAVVPLVPQDMVEPRLLKPSTSEVRVKVAADRSHIAFRIEWRDDKADERPGPALFSDAGAVQLPSAALADVPAPQMGEPGKAVEITYWSAAWQASGDGQREDIRSIYPGASIDHYPFEAAPLDADPAAKAAMTDRYAPARARGNPVAGPRESPVQDLLAEGPGTLSPAAKQVSRGSGVRTKNGWAIVLVRPLPAALAGGKRTQAAFAVWDGARGEVGAKKMRSAWVPLAGEDRK